MRKPKTTKEAMQFYALRLRNADPDSFETFLSALDSYGIETLNQMAQAPQTEVLQMQGRCQQLQALLKVLRECPSITAILDPPPPKPPQYDASFDPSL